VTKIKVHQAHANRQVQEALKLRHQIYCLGGINRCYAQPGSPHDMYDLHAIQLYVSLRRWLVFRRKVASARIITGDLPTARLLYRLQRSPAIDPDLNYCEPSRLGMLHELQTSYMGRGITLTLMGGVVEAAIQAGYEHILITLRDHFVKALSFVPWSLGDPFEYPAEESGPLVVEPMWPATLNLHELVAAMKRRQPKAYSIVFPKPPTWFDPAKARSDRELDAVVALNRRSIRAFSRDWEAYEQTPCVLPNPLAKLAAAPGLSTPNPSCSGASS
jgi:N-acyl-L-homoserine lactone synthetase